MSVRRPVPPVQDRLHEVLRTGYAARPAPEPQPQAVVTSDGTLVGSAQHAGEGVFVFVSPESLQGVRVYPPFRVEPPGKRGSLCGFLSNALES